MSYRHTLEAISESLHEIEDLVIRFPEEGDIPSIEIDLALQKLRNIYELLLAMKNIPAAAVTAVPASAPADTAAPVVTPVSAAPAGEVTAPAAAPAAPAAVPEPAPRPAPSTKPVPEAETTSAPASAAISSAQILSDRFKGRTTLHETFQSATGTIAQSRPVESLMTAIGINDRFTFIRELFNNDGQLYEQTVHTLNDAGNFNEAYNYMIQHFDWDMDSEAVQLLLEIIRRKFITGRHE